MSAEDQRLYVLSGVAFVLVGAAWITIQNLFIYKLQRAKQEVACRMLAIKVAAMGEIQNAALRELGEAKSETAQDVQFMTK
jgi:HAMP domain-containing protein